MASFLYQAVGADGAAAHGRVEADDIAAARAELETRGLSDILFHTDALDAAAYAAIFEDLGGVAISPQDELAARRRGRGYLWLAVLKANALPVAALALWNAVSIAGGRPFGWADWTGFVVTALWLALVLFGMLPALIFDRLLHASAWARWADLRRHVAWLRRLPAAAKIATHQLDNYEAKALIGLGRHAEGYALYRRHEHDPKLPRATYLSQLAALHEGARDYDGAEAVFRELCATAPGAAQPLIELGTLLARRGHRIDEATSLLDAADALEQTALARAFSGVARAIIAIDQRRAAAAVGLVTDAMEALRTAGSNPLVDGMRAVMQGFLAIAAMTAGRRREAERLWRPVLPRLQALKLKDVIGRYAAAAAGKPWKGL